MSRSKKRTIKIILQIIIGTLDGGFKILSARCAPKPDKPEPKRQDSPSAVRAILDDPPIHIRPILPAAAGAKDKNLVGSGHYGAWIVASRLLDRKEFLVQKVSRVSR